MNTHNEPAQPCMIRDRDTGEAVEEFLGLTKLQYAMIHLVAGDVGSSPVQWAQVKSSNWDQGGYIDSIRRLAVAILDAAEES